MEKNIIDDVNQEMYGETGQNSVSSNLIPYACYYDENTIITQNGELLQIIKIPSFVSNRGTASFYLLKDVLNSTFKKHSKESNLNFWFQIVRKSVDVIPKNQVYTDYTSKTVMRKWNEHYHWDRQFANEIYLSIVIAPNENTVSKSVDFVKAINFSLLRKSKLKEFEAMSKILNSSVNAILDDLKNYGVRLLKVKKMNDVYYSEHLKFFSIVVNDEKDDVKLPLNELSESLLRKRIAYGKNTLQIYNRSGSTYAAILSLKYCGNILLTQLDKLIQLDQEMVITQSVSFIDAKPINDKMMEYYETLSLVDDPRIVNLTDISNMLGADKSEDNRICASQILVQIKAKSKEDLARNVSRFFDIAGKLGLVFVREEMFMPTLFWSQLPANFSFIKRIHSIPVDNVGAYTSLFNFPTGKLTGNHWGDSMITLKTTLNTPYFFSFHNRDNANSLFIGPKVLKKTRYMNLFLISAMKQIRRLFYIDNTNRSRIFINSLGGTYYELTKKDVKNRLRINPFSMEKNQDNLEFTLRWLDCIIKRRDDGMVQIDESTTRIDQEWQKLKKIITRDFDKLKKISDVYRIAETENMKNVCHSLHKWVNPKGYSFIFDTDDSTDIFESNVTGINLNTIVNNEELKVAIFDYIVYNIVTRSDGEPAILAIDEGWLLFDNPYFGSRISTFLKLLYEKNVAVVMTTSGADSYDASSIQLSVKSVFPTQILLPNIKASIYQRKIFNISEEESRVLSVMRDSNGNFMLKHSGNVIISSIDFDFLSMEEQHILSSGNLYYHMMTKAKELINSEEPQHWLPLLFAMIREYNKVKFEETLKERERRQIQWEENKQRQQQSQG